jgi:transposase
MKERTYYTQEFKIGAVRLVIDEKMTVPAAAKDLGISHYTLSNWVYAAKKKGKDAFPGQGKLSPEDQRIRDLERRLRRAEMERDLLKKTIAFFAEQDQKNMLP